MKYEDYERRLDALFATRHCFSEAWYQIRDPQQDHCLEQAHALSYEAYLNVDRCKDALGKKVRKHFRKIHRDITTGAGISDEQYNEVFGPVDAEIRDVLRQLAADRAVFEEKAA